MYTLISAIAEPLSGDSRWAAVEIGDVPMATLFATYSNAFAILSNTFLTTQVALDLSLVRDLYGGLTTTFNQLLASLGNTALPTTTTLPVLKTRYAKWRDAFRAGYKIQPINPMVSPTVPLPASELNWLRLTRPNTDYALFKKRVMVNVNGYWHRTDGDANGIYVIDGGKTYRHSGQAQMGLFSFVEIGDLTTVPITEDMVYKQTDTQRMRDRCFINVGQDLSQKTVMLVLGGYLHVLDQKTFFRVSKSTLAIDFNNLPLFERYHESRDTLDLSSLPLERTNRNDTQVGVADFLSDENLLAYLQLSQSFLVILDNPNIFAAYSNVPATKMPGSYISYVEPVYPLVIGYGRIANYWSTYEDTQYSLKCSDNFKERPVYHTVDALVQNSVADSRLPTDPARYSAGAFLQIGRDI